MARKKKADGLPKLAAIVDMGHSLLKAGVRTVDGEWEYATIPHALRDIDRLEWEHTVERAKNQVNARDYVQIGQHYFILGVSAEKWGHGTRLEGQDRYQRDYIGAQAMSMIARLSPYPEAEIVIMALYPPHDTHHRSKLRQSLIGSWDLKLGDGSEFLFTVSSVALTAEPVAGMMNVVLNDRLQEDTSVTSVESLVLDVGGGTTSFAPVLQNAAVDYPRISGYQMGILEVTRRLEESLRRNYREYFRRTRQIAQDRLRDTLVTGKFRGGGKTLVCKDEVRRAKADLLSEIEKVYYNTSVNGPHGYDLIILTGGGSILLGDDLKELLAHNNIQYAIKDTENMHLANIKGAGKMFDLMEQEGNITL